MSLSGLENKKFYSHSTLKLSFSLKLRVQELNEELQATKESSKAARGREISLKEQVENVNQDLQRSQKTLRRVQAEVEEREQEIQELRQQVKRLKGALQVSISKSRQNGFKAAGRLVSL